MCTLQQDVLYQVACCSLSVGFEELPDVGHDRMTLGPVRTVVPDDLAAVQTLAGADHLHLVSAHVDRLAGLSLGYNETTTDIPDLTFKSTGSSQFDSYHPLPFSHHDIDVPGDDSAKVETNQATHWRDGLTEDPRELDAALGTAFATELVPSSLTPVSTESEVSRTFKGEVSLHDSLTLTEQSLHKEVPFVSDVNGTDFEYPDRAVGLGKIDGYEHQMTPLVAGLSADNHGVQTAIHVASQSLYPQSVTEKEFSLVSSNPDQILFREVCCVGCTLTERLSVYSHCDKWLQLYIDTLSADGTDRKVMK